MTPLEEINSFLFTFIHLYLFLNRKEQENISFSYMGKYDQPQEISFITSQKIEEYRNKVLENAENVKYERNKRYFTEFAQKAQ